MEINFEISYLTLLFVFLLLFFISATTDLLSDVLLSLETVNYHAIHLHTFVTRTRLQSLELTY